MVTPFLVSGSRRWLVATGLAQDLGMVHASCRWSDWDWLVLWNMFFSIQLGMSSSQHIPTDFHSIIFQRGRSTTNQICWSTCCATQGFFGIWPISASKYQSPGVPWGPFVTAFEKRQIDRKFQGNLQLEIWSATSWKSGPVSRQSYVRFFGIPPSCSGFPWFPEKIVLGSKCLKNHPNRELEWCSFC